nr:C [Anopheles flavivirus variant 1] [Anopheles flavivirus variant 1]
MQVKRVKNREGGGGKPGIKGKTGSLLGRALKMVSGDLSETLLQLIVAVVAMWNNLLRRVQALERRVSRETRQRTGDDKHALVCLILGFMVVFGCA